MIFVGECKECTIADLGEVVGGATPSTRNPENYENGDISWITPKDLSVFSGRYIHHGERNITETGLNSCSTRLLPKNTVLFSSRAPIGYVAIAAKEMCTNQGFKSVIPNDNTDFMFLYYLLKFNKDNIENMGSGTTFKEVSGNTMRSIKVCVPVNLEEQRKIATVLSAIDDKIELNNKINENLEQQAQAIFKSWFVDFEPFGGGMPEDWSETSLGKLATISTKSINPLKQAEIFLEHYSIPAYDEQHYPIFEYAKEIKSNKYILTTNSVMISKLNPDTKRIWRPLCLSENPVCSTEFIVYEAIKPKHKDYLYSLIDSQAFSDYLCAHTTGSTNSRQRATPKTTLDFPCLLPTEEIIARFCGIVTPMYEQIAAGIVENQRLAFLRDTLLPKLMNGEIDVSEVKI